MRVLIDCGVDLAASPGLTEWFVRIYVPEVYVMLPRAVVEYVQRLLAQSNAVDKAFSLWHFSNQSPELLQTISDDINVLSQVHRKHETKQEKGLVQFSLWIIICDVLTSILCQDTRMESMNHVDVLSTELHECRVARLVPVFRQA